MKRKKEEKAWVVRMGHRLLVFQKGETAISPEGTFQEKSPYLIPLGVSRLLEEGQVFS